MRAEARRPSREAVEADVRRYLEAAIEAEDRTSWGEAIRRAAVLLLPLADAGWDREKYRAILRRLQEAIDVERVLQDGGVLRGPGAGPPASWRAGLGSLSEAAVRRWGPPR